MTEVVEGAARPALERWTALALLLPALVLAWPGPGSLLEHDFIPHATGAGAAALAALPAAVLLVVRRRSTRPRGLVLILLLGVVAACATSSVTDWFEARRTALHFATALLLLTGGASLAGDGRRDFARGTVAISLLLVGFALADASNAYAGALGNTGSVAMAALPGAIAAAVLLTAEETGAFKVVCGLTVALYAGYVLRVPVVAGGLAAGVGFAVFGLARWSRSRRLLAPLAILLALAAVAAAALLPSAMAAGGGVEVRARIWTSSLAMLRDHPWLGVGPGQFAAAFPVYRDPREIELSTHERAIPVETEVEHPHQDWLLPALELGAVGGLLWIAFLALVAGSAWRAMRAELDARAALAAAAVGILAYALVHGPLLAEPAAASLAFAIFGTILARPGRAWTWPLLLLLVCAAPLARAFLRHGRWLSTIARPDAQDAAVVDRSIEAALNCCHDSALAQTLQARFFEESNKDPATVARAWEAVLTVRPHRVEALMQLAFARLRAGDFAAARDSYEKARALDPRHPGISKNLRLLDLQEGSFEAGREWLEGSDPSPELCYARAKTERAGGDPVLADLFEARAHLLWARQHAGAGRFSDAVRKYRQCLRVTRAEDLQGAPRIRLELAAALYADGREDEARAQAAGILPSEADRAALPAWAAEACRRLGLGG